MNGPRLLFVSVGICWAAYGIIQFAGLLPGMGLGDQLEQMRVHFVGRPWRWGGLLAGLRGDFLALAGILAAAWVCWRVGSVLPRWLKAERGGTARSAPALAFGLGALSLLLQGLGLVGLWFPGLFVPLLAVMLLSARGAWLPKIGLPASEGAFLSLLIIGGLVVCFAGTRTPQGGVAVDPLIYHFAAPEHFLSVHKIIATPWQPQWHLPLPVEMLYGPGFAAGGMEGAKSVNLLFLLACLGLLFRLCGILGQPAAGWFAAALFAGLGQIFFVCWQGKNDLAGTLYVLAATACILQAVRRKGAAYWLAAGIFGGWAYTGKPIHFLPVAAAFAGAAFIVPRAVALRGMLFVAAGSFLVSAGWAVQNLLFTGDPVYPHGFGLLGVDASWWPLDTEGAMRVKLSASAFFPAEWPKMIAQLGGTPWLPVGSLALGIYAPWAFAGIVRRRARFWLAAAILASGAFAMTLAGTPRYLLPQVGLLCVLAANSAAFRPVLGRAFLGFSFVASFVAVCIGTGAAGMAFLFLSGQISRDEFQLKTLTSFELMKAPLRNCVPAGKQALLIAEARRLELLRPVMAPSTFAVSPIWRVSHESASAAEIRKKFRQFNVSCFVYNCVSATYHAERKYPGPAWSQRQLKVYRDFFASYARLEKSPVLIDKRNGGFYIWSLAGRPHPPNRLLPALPGTEGEFTRAIMQEEGEMDTAMAEQTLLNLKELGEFLDGVGSYHAITGFIAGLIGEKKRATLEYEKSVSCGYFSENNLTDLVELHLQVLNVARAGELLKMTEALYPKEDLPGVTAAYHMTLAYVAGLMNRRREAARQLKLAAACEPRSPRLLIALSEAFRRLGLLFQAQIAIERAMELDPGRADALLLSERINDQIKRLTSSIPEDDLELNAAPQE